MGYKETVIVTGGSKGIGAAVVPSSLDRGYAVVATARNTSDAPFAASPQDVADVVMYLAEAKNVTGEVIRVDAGSHVGKW